MKKRYLAAVIICVLIMAAGGTSAYMLQKNKETPEERSNTTTKTTSNASSENSTTSEKSVVEGVGDNVLMVGAIKIEMLSADVIEGSEISTENRYPVEYFRDQTLPDPEETEDIIDWDSIYEEAPEVKDLQLSDYDAYTAEESEEIIDRNKNVIDKYTYTKVKPRKFYFIKCKLTNMGNADVEDAFPYDVVYDSPEASEISYNEALCYYDKPIYTDGDERAMKYYFFRLKGHESMECTIGLAVPQEFDENEKHYYGNLITGNFSYDPAKLPDYVDIDSLPKTETDDQ